jgi:hypothetical protein
MANALVDDHREVQPGKHTLLHFTEVLGAIAGRITPAVREARSIR